MAEDARVFVVVDGSNCTFMELKLGRRSKLAAGRQVLIVPLWN